MNLFAHLFQQHSAAPPNWIEDETMSAWLPTDDAPPVVDVRGADEFTGLRGRIDGEINIPLPDQPAHVDNLRTNRKPLVLVCETDRRSSAAADQLRAAGFANISVLRGGMERWRTLGLR